ncbi:uncharacterized protein LOC113503857 isoform X2 [Trichoplusia ni]|uniref:Uncharacterized protein LOC113503857 isoform X2 n=1 Tax=Trichoplusia ni TaxID=7111 RepID=A0A7E5WNQ8_TRINI|nr:uncharacterized protein LOC113503857 isoform X2 [Trichoplusia ni]
MATRRRVLRTVQNTRASRILALVPEDNAASEVSEASNSENEYEAETYNRHRTSESSEAPTLDSSLERLNILDSSDDDRNMNSPSVSANIEALPSISSLPVLSPMSNIPSVTTSFIIDQMVNLPPQSPQNISSPRLTRRTRTERQIQSTNVRPRHVIKKKKIDLKFRWSNGRFQHYAELEPDEFQSPIPDNKCAYDYFSDFFSEDLFAEICQYSNMYAMQLTGQSINLTVEELRNFISIKVIMGIVSMPSYLLIIGHRQLVIR